MCQIDFMKIVKTNSCVDSPQGRLCAFALIDLPALTGNIAILAAMLLPALASAAPVVSLTASLEARFTDTSSALPRIVDYQSPPLSLPADTWVHVALTFDRSSGQSQLYLNGVSVAQTNLGAFRPQTAAPIYLGRSRSMLSDYYAMPGLDEFAVYNRVLEPAEIRAIAAADVAGKCPPPPTCAPLPAECIAWWRCESNLLDNAGINHGSVTGTVVSVPGRVGSALYLNGGVGRVPGSDPLNVGACPGLTAAAWINGNSGPVVQWNDSKRLTNSMGVSLSYSYRSGVLEADLVDTDSQSHKMQSPFGVLDPSIWQHVAVTYDKATGLAALYCDGNLVTQRKLGSFTPRTTGDLYLGYNPPGPYSGSGSWFQGGYLDEVTVHARALSAMEIKTMAKAGAEGNCKRLPTIVSQPACMRVNIGSPVQFDIEAAGNPVLRYQWFKDGALLPGATGASLVIAAAQDADAANYAVLVTNWFGTALSSNALLTLNHAPIADASATSTPVIAPLQGLAAVALDGTRSFDPDGSPLAFLWFLDGKAIATGVVAIVDLPAGAANIALVANDGLLQATNLVTVQILTPARAIENLMAAVSGSVPRSQPLLATLGAALASVNRYNAEAAVNELQAFQNKVRVQISPPTLAESLIAQAQEILEVLNAPPSGAVGLVRLEQATRHANGRFKISLSGRLEKVCIVEGSPDLRHWEPIALMRPDADGKFEFEDRAASSLSQRFYRIKTP